MDVARPRLVGADRGHFIIESPTMDDYAKRLSNTTKLDDDCLMPFGTHKGKRLGDVPDHYFRWFLGQDWCDQWPDLLQYANHVIDD